MNNNGTLHFHVNAMKGTRRNTCTYLKVCPLVSTVLHGPRVPKNMQHPHPNGFQMWLCVQFTAPQENESNAENLFHKPI